MIIIVPIVLVGFGVFWRERDPFQGGGKIAQMYGTLSLEEVLRTSFGNNLDATWRTSVALNSHHLRAPASWLAVEIGTQFPHYEEEFFF